MKNWMVYILQCKDGTFYTGITKDLDRRLKQHNAGKASKYTRARLPVNVIWSKSGFSESTAKKEEARIKKLSRKEKARLMN